MSQLDDLMEALAKAMLSMTYPEDKEHTDAVRLADAIRDALAEDNDALVMGSVESRCVLIDGNFDLIEVAEQVIARLAGR